METLDDPRKLQYTLKITEGSDLEKFLQTGKPAPRLSQGSQSSQSAKNSLDDVSAKFRSAMGMFGDVNAGDDFTANLEKVLETSQQYIPEKRALAKALQETLDELLLPEEKGGVSKEVILDTVSSMQQAYEAMFATAVDRKLAQELLATLRQAAAAAGQANGNPQRRASWFPENDDEDPEDLDVSDGEEEEPDQAAPASDLRDPSFIEKKRREITATPTLVAERATITKAMTKVLDLVRDKRDYHWSLNGDKISEHAGEQASELHAMMEQTVIQDPITRKDIVDPVKSSRCRGAHVYDRGNLMPMLVREIARDDRGMKCSYRGCNQRIKAADIIPDGDYLRFLVRRAREQDND